jgi:hypothetical protein
MNKKPENHLAITLDFVQSLHPKGIEFWAAYSTIRKYYCQRMFVVGLCPQNCQLCAPAIGEELDLTIAKYPAALLAWRMKRAQAVKKETPRPVYKPQSDPLGFDHAETNPFLELAK